MLTNERKEQLLDQILDLMTAVAYDREPNEVAVPSTAKTPTIDKVEMLTIKESAELIGGLSEHTVRRLVAHGKVKSVRTGEGKRGKILVNKADLLMQTIRMKVNPHLNRTYCNYFVTYHKEST